MYGIEYSTSLFISCHQPCHGEIVNARKTTKKTENYRLRRDIVLAAGVSHNRSIDKPDNYAFHFWPHYYFFAPKPCIAMKPPNSVRVSLQYQWLDV